MILAAHQPNLVAWLPYFEKIRKADVFVMLGEVQFVRDYYQHRFNIGPVWYTMPVVHEFTSIREKQYKLPREAWEGLKRRLPQYAHVMSIFDDYVSESLWDMNTAIIKRICELLGISISKIVEDYPTSLTKNERLIDLCKHYGCDTYLSGSGAAVYNDERMYADAGIKLIYQDVSAEDKRPILGVLCQMV